MNDDRHVFEDFSLWVRKINRWAWVRGRAATMTGDNRRRVSLKDWVADGVALFGPDHKKWVYKCPVCAHETSHQQWLDAGASEGEVGFSCIGRRLKDSKGAMTEDGSGGPCNYAGGGLFRLNPVVVVTLDGHERETFEFGSKPIS